MRPLVLVILASFLSFLFSKSVYNLKNRILENAFLLKDTSYTDRLISLEKNKQYSKHEHLHKLNLVSYNNKITTEKDSVFFEHQDSLLATITSREDWVTSSVINKNVYLHFLNEFGTNLIQETRALGEEDLLKLDDLIEELKDALRKDGSNNIARHNLTVLVKLKQHSDYYYNKAQDLSELIYDQIQEDLSNDSSIFQKTLPWGYKTLFQKEIDAIRTEKKKELCNQEIEDSLNNILTSDFLDTYHKKTIDSIKVYDNIDTDLIGKLKSDKTTEEIINEFYDKEYPELYSKASKESISKTLADKETQETVKDIIYKYLDPDQKQESNEKKESDEQKDNKENKEKNESLDNNKESNENREEKKNNSKDNSSQDKNDSNQSSNEKEKNGDNSQQANEQKNNSDDPSDQLESQKKDGSGNEDKKKRMQDELKDRKEKNSSDNKYNQEPVNEKDNKQSSPNDQNPSQENKSGESESQPKGSFEKHNMTKENADQTLKAIEQRADRYLQSQKRAQRRDLEYGSSKPDW